MRREHSGSPRVALTLATAALVLTPGAWGWSLAEAPDAGQESSSTRDTLDRFIHQLMELKLGPGMAVAAVRGDDVVYLRGFGFADVEAKRSVTPDTVFYIASSTKSFTGLAAAILHERGELDLDAPLSRSLPGVVLHEPLDPDRITLRDLLTHTHGIDGRGPVTFRAAYSGEHTPDQMVRLLRHHPPAEEGRAFRYSNIGYNTASLAMDASLGMSWKDLLQREIFDPLEMRSTSGYVSRIPTDRLAMPYRPEADGFTRQYYAKGDENMHAAGGLVTTAADLALWLRANVNGGRLGDRQILNARAIAEAHRPHAEQNDQFMHFQRIGYGLGWNTGSYEGDAFTHHFGGFSGFHAQISFMPEHKIGVAVLVNTGVGALLAELTSRYIYDTLLEKPDLEAKYERELETARTQAAEFREMIAADRARRASRPQELPYPLEAYAGTYESEILGRLVLEVVDGSLEARMGRLWSRVEVYDHTDNILRVELRGRGDVVAFLFDEGSEGASALRYLGQAFRRLR